jgi:hypothetical protein
MLPDHLFKSMEGHTQPKKLSTWHECAPIVWYFILRLMISPSFLPQLRGLTSLFSVYLGGCYAHRGLPAVAVRSSTIKKKYFSLGRIVPAECLILLLLPSNVYLLAGLRLRNSI